MVDIELLRKIVDKGLSIEEGICLILIDKGVLDYSELVNDQVISSLIFDGWLGTSEYLTIKSINFLKELGIKQQNTPGFDYKALFERVKIKLKEVTGKSQIVAKIQDKGYSFLPNEQDFTKKLQKAIKEYKLTDFNKIEAVLVEYIEECNRSKNWFPIMTYYIHRDRVGSAFAGDYESYIPNKIKKSVNIEDNAVNL